MNRRNLLFSIIFLFLFSSAQASYVKVDTLYPYESGSASQWAGAFPHVNQIDEEGCAGGDSLAASTAGYTESYTLNQKLFVPWIDSVYMLVCGNATSASNLVAFGRGKYDAGFVFCGDTTSTAFPGLTTPYSFSVRCPRDTCAILIDAWDAYRILQNEWGVRLISILSKKVDFLQSSKVVTYSTYPDTLPSGEESVCFATASACFCSTWAVDACNNADSCLGTFSGARFFKTNVAGNIQAWNLSTLSLPSNTRIDSVQEWYEGFAIPDEESLIQAGYVTKSGETCTMWDSTGIIFSGTGGVNGWLKIVTHTTCPATSLPWVISDLNDVNKGFGLKCLYDSWFAVNWFRAIIFLSYQEEVLKISGSTNVDDAWIGSGSDANYNYGGQYYMWAIQAGDGFFVGVKNLATLLPAYTVISTCVCSIFCSVNATDANISIYRVFKPTVEGDQTGQTCADSGVTWNNWRCSNSAWGTAGVGCAGDDGVDNSQNGTCDATGRDRKATPETTVNVTTVDTWYGWSVSPELAQGWYDGTIAERGVVFINDDGVGSNQFYSTEQDVPYRPFWTITYTVSGTGPTVPGPARIYDNGNVARIYDNGTIFNIFK